MSGVFPRQKRTLSAADIVVSPYLPAPVDGLFRQARHNLVLRNWDVAGMTYRKTLEVALRAKFCIEGGNLATTIARLSKSQPAVSSFTLGWRAWRETKPLTRRGFWRLQPYIWTALWNNW